MVAAATVASVLVLTQGAAHARRAPALRLPRNLVGAPLTIALINPGPPPQQDSRPVSEMLYLSATGLAFTAAGGVGQAAPSEEWTANQMGGGTYIFIHVPDGRCLTAPASRGGAAATAATLTRCNLSLSQRWRHHYLGKDPAGRDNWQLRSAADGLCLTAMTPPLGGQPGESGVGLRACRTSAIWRQIVSFRTAY
jgi:hypothetical protein